MRGPRLGLLLFFLLPGPAGAAPPAATGGCAPGAYLAAWRAEAIGRAVDGAACWIVGEQGELRLEVALGGPDRLVIEDLFTQTGNGWTLVLGDPGQGTFNPWADAWREVTPGLESWVRSALLCRGPGTAPIATRRTAPRPRFARDPGTTAVHRWIAPRLALDPQAENAGSVSARGFRGRMARRGLGRGADREIARLEVFEAGPSENGWTRGTRLRLTGSRRPGRLEWTVLERSATPAMPPEVFLPLWPLADWLDPARVFPGTR